MIENSVTPQVKIDNPQIVTPVGFDPGNGFAKICLFDKVAKIPANFAYEQPQGELSSKTMARLKAKSFSLIIDDREHWFGLDSLDNGSGRIIDLAKYSADYLQALFSASIVQWLKQHREKPSILDGHILNVVGSMPPELYQDKAQRGKVEKAYKEAFRHRIGWHVQSSEFDTFQLFTRFRQVAPETITYMAVNRAKVGFTLLFDLGYGTLDIAIFKDGSDTPLLTRSLNKGILHAFESINPIQVNQVELSILRAKSYSQLDNYFGEVRNIIQAVARKLTGDISVIGLGGGVKLMSNEARDLFSRAFDNLTLKDEFANAQSNAKVAANG